MEGRRKRAGGEVSAAVTAKRMRPVGEEEKAWARAQKSVRGMRQHAESQDVEMEGAGMGKGMGSAGIVPDDGYRDNSPGMLVVRTAGGTWRAVGLSMAKKKGRPGDEDNRMEEPKRRTLAHPSEPSLPLAILVERTAPGGMWKAASADGPRQPLLPEPVAEVPAPLAQAPPTVDIDADDDEYFKEPPQLVVQRDSMATSEGTAWEAIIAADDGELYYVSSDIVACKDPPKAPTALIFGDGSSIEEAILAFDTMLYSLAIGVCAKNMALARLQALQDLPEPVVFMADDEGDDTSKDEPEFDSMEACYRVLFKLIDGVLIEIIDQLPPGEATIDVPSTKGLDAGHIGVMQRPNHILEELVDILRLLRQSEISTKPLTPFEFHVDVLAVWRMAKESENPILWSIARELSVKFDTLFNEQVYQPMQAIRDETRHIPRMGSRIRVYDAARHEWWLGTVESLSEDVHKVLVRSNVKPSPEAADKVWVRVPSFKARIISPSELYLLLGKVPQKPDASIMMQHMPSSFQARPSPCGSPLPALHLHQQHHQHPSADVVIIPRAYHSQRGLLFDTIELPGFRDSDFDLEEGDVWLHGMEGGGARPKVLSLVPQPLPQTSPLPAPKRRGGAPGGNSLGLGWEEDGGMGGGSRMKEPKRITAEEAAAAVAQRALWKAPEERPDYDAAMVEHVNGEHGESNWGVLQARFPEMSANYFRNRWSHVKCGWGKLGGTDKIQCGAMLGVPRQQKCEMAKRYDDDIRRHLEEHGPARWGLLEEKFPERMRKSRPGSGKFFSHRYNKFKGRAGYFRVYS